MKLFNVRDLLIWLMALLCLPPARGELVIRNCSDAPARDSTYGCQTDIFLHDDRHSFTRLSPIPCYNICNYAEVGSADEEQCTCRCPDYMMRCRIEKTHQYSLVKRNLDSIFYAVSDMSSDAVRIVTRVPAPLNIYIRVSAYVSGSMVTKTVTSPDNHLVTKTLMLVAGRLITESIIAQGDWRNEQPMNVEVNDRLIQRIPFADRLVTALHTDLESLAFIYVGLESNSMAIDPQPVKNEMKIVQELLASNQTYLTADAADKICRAKHKLCFLVRQAPFNIGRIQQRDTSLVSVSTCIENKTENPKSDVKLEEDSNEEWPTAILILLAMNAVLLILLVIFVIVVIIRFWRMFSRLSVVLNALVHNSQRRSVNDMISGSPIYDSTQNSSASLTDMLNIETPRPQTDEVTPRNRRSGLTTPCSTTSPFLTTPLPTIPSYPPPHAQMSGGVDRFYEVVGERVE